MLRSEALELNITLIRFTLVPRTYCCTKHVRVQHWNTKHGAHSRVTEHYPTFLVVGTPAPAIARRSSLVQGWARLRPFHKELSVVLLFFFCFFCFFFVFFSLHGVINTFAPLFPLSLLFVVVTQIRGHTIYARLFLPPPHYGSCLAFLLRDDFSFFFPGQPASSCAYYPPCHAT